MGVEDYHVIELVGEGSFGKVYKGRRKFTRQVEQLMPILPLRFLFRWFMHIFNRRYASSSCFQTVAMKFILKHGKSEKDIHNLRQEIEVFHGPISFLFNLLLLLPYFIIWIYTPSYLTILIYSLAPMLLLLVSNMFSATISSQKLHNS